jgi:hypothetical protein
MGVQPGGIFRDTGGTQRLALAHRGNEYRIADADGTTATVQRLIDGVVDPSWSGFSPHDD